MLQASNRSYVCWQCATRRLGPAMSPLSPRSRIPSVICKAPSRKGLATVNHPSSRYGYSSARNESASRATIRERLRKWEEENPTQGQMMLGDFADDGGLTNNLTRPQNVGMVHLETEENSSPWIASNELVDLRSDDAILDPGDLVEISSEGSRRPVLAICLGRINGYEHYYTISGKWFSSIGIKTLFVVNNFATKEELQPVVEALPPHETRIEDLNILQDLGEGPSRAAGAVLLRKMLQFAQDSEAVYQANAGTLDASSSFIGDPIKHRYLTLHEIAELLLPDNNKRDGKFNPQSLYAVHRALLQDEIFFRPLHHTGHKRSYLFEVSPLSEVRIILKVEKMVRDYMDHQGNYQSSRLTIGSPVEDFLSTAQKAIDASRKNREFTQSGIIGPSSKGPKAPREQPYWSLTDLEILHFIELWASYQKFPMDSRLQTYGSALLRAMDRYQEAKGYLPATGWTFLQEVGWIPPWEIPARYRLRFPGVEIKRGGSYVRPFLGILDRHLKRDTLSLIRQPLHEGTAYCIDDITAREIDDAISLERTGNPEEFWIHVHVADPASSFGADTPVAKHAELIPESVYLPGHLESMLPESIVQERFSLAPDRPCLTFSALVNTEGLILEEKITANTLKDVMYLTYEDAASVIGEIREDPYAEGAQLRLGKAPKATPPNRKMNSPGDLTEGQKSDLAILSKLGKMIQAGRLKKGASPFFQPRPMATIGFDGVKQKEQGNFIATSGDPLISIHYAQNSGTDLVENAMKLGNEIAARWCHERSIPIPYRTQPYALRNAALVHQYARDVLNPMLISGRRPDESVWRHMRSLLGTDEVTTTPGPHFTLGSDMYTKATSPLRRFSDLIVHWQIEAALLEEKKLGHSLVVHNKGKKKKSLNLDFLPFSRERLDRMLPMLSLREKQARALTNVDGVDQWILQGLVRAWRFKEAPLPETFKMTVGHLTPSRTMGRLDWFERRATLKHDSLNGVIRGPEICMGDVIEVRLIDVNVHSKQILVEAVRMLERADEKKQMSDGTHVPLMGAEIDDATAQTASLSDL